MSLLDHGDFIPKQLYLGFRHSFLFYKETAHGVKAQTFIQQVIKRIFPRYRIGVE